MRVVLYLGTWKIFDFRICKHKAFDLLEDMSGGTKEVP